MGSSCAGRPAGLADSTVARRRGVRPAARPGRVRLPRVRGRRSADHSWLLLPASLDDLGSGPPPAVAADPRSSMGPRLVPGRGSYSGCQVTRSNSLPSGSANVVWRTAATPGGSAAGGSLIWWSGLAPRPVSRSVSSSWWSVTRTGWMLFLVLPGVGGWWRIIRGPLSGPVASTAVSPATAPGLTGRPRALPQKSAKAAGSAQSMVRAAKLRLTVVVMIASFRWVDSSTTAASARHQRLWRISEDEALTCPGEQVLAGCGERHLSRRRPVECGGSLVDRGGGERGDGPVVEQGAVPD